VAGYSYRRIYELETYAQVRKGLMLGKRKESEGCKMSMRVVALKIEFEVQG